MELLGAVIGVADVAARTTSKVWALCENWRDAPHDFHRLKDDLTRIQLFFRETQEGLSSAPHMHRAWKEESDTDAKSAPRFPGDTSSLGRLLEVGMGVLRRLEHVVDDLRGTSGLEDGDVLRRSRRLKWMANAAKVNKLKQELGDVTTGICRFLVVRNVSISADIAFSIQQMETFVERSVQSSADAITSNVEKTVERTIELSRRRTIDEMDSRLEVFEHTVVGAIRGPRGVFPPLRPQKASDAAVPWASMVQHIASPHHRVFQCKPACHCTCHLISSYSLSLATLRSVLGAIAVAYHGSVGTSASGVCPQCGTRRHRSVQIVYSFPSWIVRASLTIFCSTNLNGVPQMNLRVANEIPYDSTAYLSGVFGRTRVNDIKGLKLALSQGQGSVFDTDPIGHTALSLAVSFGRYEAAQILLSVGADPFSTIRGQGMGTSAAGIAFRNCIGTRQMDKFADLFGSVTTYVERVGYTPLHLAILEILHFNIDDALRKPEFAAMIEKESADSYTPLALAVMTGNVAATKSLIQAGARTTVPTKHTSLLHRIGCHSKSVDIVEMLIQAGADVDAIDEYGRTPLAYLCIYNLGKKVREDTSAMFKLLIRHASNVNHVSFEGIRALDYAAISGDSIAARILIENGADMNARDFDGDQAITSALSYSHYDLCKTLLELGADVTNINNTGRSILHNLANYGDAEMFRIFTDAKMRGIAVHGKDAEGRTALQMFSDRSPSGELRKAFDELLDSVEEDEGIFGISELDVLFSPVEETLDADVFYDAREY